MASSYFICCTNLETKLSEHFKVPHSIYVYIKQLECQIYKLKNKIVTEKMTKTEIEKLIKRWDESLVDENEEFEEQMAKLVKLVIEDVLYYVEDEVNYEAGRTVAKNVDAAIKEHYGLKDNETANK
jgi:hypothetical protein